jgi:hypothetical protein
MGRPRVNPPSDAATTIETLASKGHSTIGLAKHFKVSRSVIARWFEENEMLEEVYEQGRDSYRQYLEDQVRALTLAGKNPAGFIYLLKSKFKQFDVPSNASKVDVGVNTQSSNVMVVISHGSDEEWEKRAAAQQTALTANAGSQSRTIEAMPLLASETSAGPLTPSLPTGAQEQPAVPAWRPPALASHAPIAPSWRGNA